MVFNFYGRSYPLRYTLSAQRSVADHFGGLDEMQAELNKGALESVSALAFVLSAMMEGGEREARLRAKLSGESRDPVTVPSFEDLLDALSIGDAGELSELVTDCLREGNTVTVELQESSPKNAEASRGSR